MPINTNRPARLLATFRISDRFEGDYDIVVTDELAKPTTTNERTFIVRGRDGVLINEWPDGLTAIKAALQVAGWFEDDEPDDEPEPTGYSSTYTGYSTGE